jgi:hypothetical protein
MALGALFGVVKLTYAAVSVRTREIATLRAMGYQALPVAASVLLESVVLCVAGALVGASLAWLLFNGKLVAALQNVFTLSVSPHLFALGIAWALALAVFGGLWLSRYSVASCRQFARRGYRWPRRSEPRKSDCSCMFRRQESQPAIHTGSSRRYGSSGSSTTIRSPGRTSPPTSTMDMMPALRRSAPSGPRAKVAAINPGCRSSS